MRRLLMSLLVVVAMTGCSDRMVYQTRYLPEDIDSSFALQSVTWTGDPEAIELPAAPPDIDAQHPPRVDCTYPYQKFKPRPIVAYSKEQVRSYANNDLIKAGVLSDFDRPVGPDVELTRPRMSGYGNSPYALGVSHTNRPLIRGGFDTRTHSTTGAGTDVNYTSPQVNGGLNSRNYNPYCCGDGPGEGNTNTVLGWGR